MKKSIYFLLICCLYCSCRHEPPKLTTAFYHWKTALALSQEERTYLDSLKSNKLYVKFFDIDWDAQQQMAIPLAEVQVAAHTIRSLEVIPCIFITNRTFKQLPDDQVEDLTDKVLKKIKELAQQLPAHKINELQFDCDWSKSTRAIYFRFLEVIKKKAPEYSLSATIRLHQIKFANQTGIPPVERGMLMCYNMGDVDKVDTPNSIFDINILKQYLEGFENYTLDLDIALPIFYWGVLIRDNKVIKLINNLDSEALSDSTLFAKKDAIHFDVLKSTYLKGYYLYEGDQLRLEHVSFQDLSAGAYLMKNVLPQYDRTISYYHLDTTTIKYYPHGKMEKIYTIF